MKEDSFDNLKVSATEAEACWDFLQGRRHSYFHNLPLPCQHQWECPTTMLTGSPAKAIRHTESTQGTPLECLALVARQAYASGPYRSETLRETVFGRLQPPKHFKESRLKHTPSLPMEKPIYLSWRDRLQVYHRSPGYRSTLRECELENAIFAFSLGLATACQ